jgi:hypothetical protein
MKATFKEEQKFTQWWLWLILISVGFLPALGIYKQIIVTEPFGDKPVSDIGLMIFAIFSFSLILLFALMKLKTAIDGNGIEIRFFPFVHKRINWVEIKKASIVDYGFVGGWGIRLWTSYGTVYNCKGNIGLAIELVNGKKYLIGTQKETEMGKILNQLHPYKTLQNNNIEG